ncbi:MAG: 1,6-anhydro-N-acetylmuramyl-L-alanine amidase AmpD [Gallionella sp.]
MRIDSRGMLDACDYIPSPNCDDRPECAIELLVIHNISLPPGEFAGDAIPQFFTNTLNPAIHPYFQTLAGMKVSSHFLVRRNGHITQFVPCTKRAWHAGVSSWQGRTRCNDFSVGIEMEGADTVPFTDEQYIALGYLTMALRAAYPVCAIAGHSDIAPRRKTDPGPCFDWTRYLVSVCSAQAGF